LRLTQWCRQILSMAEPRDGPQTGLVTVKLVL